MAGAEGVEDLDSSTGQRPIVFDPQRDQSGTQWSPHFDEPPVGRGNTGGGRGGDGKKGKGKAEAEVSEGLHLLRRQLLSRHDSSVSVSASVGVSAGKYGDAYDSTYPRDDGSVAGAVAAAKAAAQRAKRKAGMI